MYFLLLFDTIVVNIYQLSGFIAIIVSTWFIFWQVNKSKLEKKADKLVYDERLKYQQMQVANQEIRLLEHDQKNDVQFKAMDSQFVGMNESISKLMDKTDEIYAILINFKN